MKKAVEPDLENQWAELETGNERVLLVDDEIAITKLGKRTLERLGYTVTIRSDSVVKKGDRFIVRPGKVVYFSGCESRPGR